MARPTMHTINIIMPGKASRHWHMEIANRLTQAGFKVTQLGAKTPPQSLALNAILRLEKILFNRPSPSLSDPATCPAEHPAPSADLTLDFSTDGAMIDEPVLRLIFSCGNHFHQIAAAIAKGELPDISANLDGTPIATARPMIDNRVVLSAGLEDVLARTISLTLAVVKKLQKQGLKPKPVSPIPTRNSHGFLRAYLTRTLPGLVREIWRRKNYRFAHWRIGYRFIDAKGVAETSDLSGADWHILPDDGTRFYADPFPFEHAGKHFIFVEDYPHATGKAVISVARIDEDGTASKPQPIIEEDWHLSYPQVFARNGEIWMLPEASNGNALILYRAESFPDKWVQHKTLIKDCQLSDATLLEQDGYLWLFATDRDGAGSTSDMLVVYRADKLDGPWEAHPANPILIDRANARPGGAFIQTEGKIVLPVQDSTLGYGGGLGLCEITKLSPTEVSISTPTPISINNYWPYPRIHTLNRAGRLETIDGIAEVRK